MTEKELQANCLQDGCYDLKESQTLKLRRSQKLAEKRKIAYKPQKFVC